MNGKVGSNGAQYVRTLSLNSGNALRGAGL